jgi:hypothetical protein
MATQTIKMVFQFRRDTTANWLANKDVVPAAGEPCFDLELNTLKMGDGVKTYEQLEPIGGVSVDADGKSLVFKDGVLALAGFDAADVGAQPRKNADGNIEWVVPSTETVDGLKSAVAGLQSDVEALQKADSSVLSKIESLEHKVDGVGEGTVDAKINAKIDAFAKEVTDNGTIDTIQELFDYVATHGADTKGMVKDIADLKGLVGSESVQSQIANAIVGKVDKVEGMGLSSNDFTDSLLGKLKAIEENAQVNVIEKISVGGSVLDVVDKTVHIPVAGTDRAGVVKSATGANKVNISNDGVMSVNKINVHSVFVPIGDELVLDGGSASKDAPIYPTRIGNMGFNSISDAVNCADNGDIITLQEDVSMGAGDNDHLVVKSENVTIDLGGKALTANGSNGAVKVEGGVTTLDGVGAVNGTLGSDNYSMAVWADNGTVVINGGTYKNETDGSVRGTDLIYASGNGCIEINGGIFEAAKPEWTLNVKDVDYKAGTAKIVVKGGSFKGFDPANNNAEGTGTNFVAEGYKSVFENGYYVVKPI